jgi:hypothetical protein
MVGYAVVLLGVVIAISAKSDNDGGIGDAVGGLLRIVAEALFWTFHPFSPMALTREPTWMRSGGQVRGRGGRFVRSERVPFYEKVNRFAFGPPKKATDVREVVGHVLTEARRLQGRLGPADVMRVTGLPREHAEAVLARMVVDYEGEIAVSNEGAILYRFPALRLTALAANRNEEALAAPPVWTKREEVRPLTGNSARTNVLFGAINGFNVLASGFVLANHLTFERIGQLLTTVGDEAAMTAVQASAASGTPIVLGLIPFGFSLALFALPLGRVLARRRERRAVAAENGRRALLKVVLEQMGEGGVLDGSRARRAWEAGAGTGVSGKQLTEEIRTLGGEPDVDEDGKSIFRFADLARERQSLAQDRRDAPAEEQRAGAVLFSSLE